MKSVFSFVCFCVCMYVCVSDQDATAPLDVQSSPSSCSSTANRPSSADTDLATREFIDFLKPLKYGRQIFRQCRAFTESMAYKRVSASTIVPDVVKMFLFRLIVILWSHLLYSLPSIRTWELRTCPNASRTSTRVCQSAFTLNLKVRKCLRCIVSHVLFSR